jgi:hypothetical protein
MAATSRDKGDKKEVALDAWQLRPQSLDPPRFAQRAEIRQKIPADIHRTTFDFIRLQATMVLVDGFDEKPQPALEMVHIHIQGNMGRKRAPVIVLRSEQKGVPEIIDLRKVGLPMHLGHIVENRANQGILPHFGVEGIEHHNKIFALADIRLEGGVHGRAS